MCARILPSFSKAESITSIHNLTILASLRLHCEAPARTLRTRSSSGLVARARPPARFPGLSTLTSVHSHAGRLNIRDLFGSCQCSPFFISSSPIFPGVSLTKVPPASSASFRSRSRLVRTQLHCASFPLQESKKRKSCTRGSGEGSSCWR